MLNIRPPNCLNNFFGSGLVGSTENEMGLLLSIYIGGMIFKNGGGEFFK